MKGQETLTAREQLFCSYQALLGEPFEAARRAGYARSRLDKTMGELLGRKDIRLQTDRMYGYWHYGMGNAALTGLARVALGNVTDVARLVADEKLTAEELEKLDLFAVSEVRRRKDGTLEVKMVDRIAALRLLLEYTHRTRSGEDGMQQLTDALDRAAQAAESCLAEQDRAKG